MKVFAVLMLAAGANALAAPSRTPFGYAPVVRYQPTSSYAGHHSLSQYPYFPQYVIPRSYTQRPVYEKPSPYNFDYVVKDYSGNDFGHHETKNGQNTYGAYYVQLPDGRRQKVTYTVTPESGYVAKVTYEGEAKYPVQPSSYQPSYVYTYG